MRAQTALNAQIGRAPTICQKSEYFSTGIETAKANRTLEKMDDEDTIEAKRIARGVCVQPMVKSTAAASKDDLDARIQNKITKSKLQFSTNNLNDGIPNEIVEESQELGKVYNLESISEDDNMISLEQDHTTANEESDGVGTGKSHHKGSDRDNMDDEDIIEAKRKARGGVKSTGIISIKKLDAYIQKKIAQSKPQISTNNLNCGIPKKMVPESQELGNVGVLELISEADNMISIEQGHVIANEELENVGPEGSYHQDSDDGAVFTNEPTEACIAGDDGLAIAIAVSPKNEDEEDIHVAIEFDPDIKTTKNKKRRRKAFGVAFLLLITIVVIAILVPLKSKKSPLTESPTLSPTRADIETQIEDFFGFDIDSDGSFGPPRSPEDVPSEDVKENLQKALEWLEQDGWDQNEPNVIQRFLMAFLSFTWQAKNWTYCEPNIKNFSNTECNGLSFSEDGSKTINASRWLSKDHECKWFGVWCPVEDIVAGINLGKYNYCILDETTKFWLRAFIILFFSLVIILLFALPQLRMI